jgi:hypothetical protein
VNPRPPCYFPGGQAIELVLEPLRVTATHPKGMDRTDAGNAPVGHLNVSRSLRSRKPLSGCRQLKNRRLLPFHQVCEQYDLAIRKF